MLKVLNKSMLLQALIALAALNGGCAPDAGTESLLMEDNRPQELGQGRDSITGEGRGNCLVVTKTVKNEVISKPRVVGLQSLQHLANELGLTPGEVALGAASSPLGQLALTYNEDPRILNLLVRFQKNIADETLSENSPTADLGEMSFEEFTSSCGDEYVKKLSRGHLIYAIVPVYLDSYNQRAKVIQSLEPLAQQEQQIMPALGQLPVGVVNYLYLGKLGGAKDSGQIIAETPFNDFRKFYLATLASTQVLNGTNSVVTERAYGKLSEKISDTFGADTVQGHDAFSASVNFLKGLDLKVKSCEQTTQLMQKRPLEFDSQSVGPVMTAVQNFKNVLLESQAPCDSVLRGESQDMASCVIPPDLVSLHALVDTQCLSAPLGMKATDAFFYREFALKGKLGAMKTLSEKAGTVTQQAFDKGYLIRPKGETPEQYYFMNSMVYDTWQKRKDQLKDPSISATIPYVIRTIPQDVYQFAGGRLYHNLKAGKVFYVNRMIPHIKDTDIPTTDERDLGDGKFDLDTESLSYFVSKGKTASSPVVIKLDPDDLFAKYLPMKFLGEWALPVSAPKSLGTLDNDRYVEATDGYYHTNKKAENVFHLSDRMHALYLAKGGPKVLGSVRLMELCTTECVLIVEGGYLRLNSKGESKCHASEWTLENGLCVDKNEYCSKHKFECIKGDRPVSF